MTTVQRTILAIAILAGLAVIYFSTFTSKVDTPPGVGTDTVMITEPYFQKHLTYRMQISDPKLKSRKVTGIRTYCSCTSAEIVDDSTLSSSERAIRLKLNVNQGQPVGSIRFSLVFDDSSTIEVKKAYRIVYGFETLPPQEFLFLKNTKNGSAHGTVAFRNNDQQFSRTANVAITRNGELVSQKSVVVPGGFTKTSEIRLNSMLIRGGASPTKMEVVVTVSELPHYKHTFALYSQ